MRRVNQIRCYILREMRYHLNSKRPNFYLFSEDDTISHIISEEDLINVCYMSSIPIHINIILQPSNIAIHASNRGYEIIDDFDINCEPHKIPEHYPEHFI